MQLEYMIRIAVSLYKIDYFYDMGMTEVINNDRNPHCLYTGPNLTGLYYYCLLQVAHAILRPNR